MKLLYRLFPVLCILVVVLVNDSNATYKYWHKVFDGQGEAVGINPLNTNTIYSQGFDNRLYISHNGGKTWDSPLAFLPNATREILVHPNDTLTIFAVAFSGGLYKSTNGGSSFNLIPSMSFYGIDGVSLEVDPSHPDTMYAGNFADAAVYRTTNRGVTWNFAGNASAGNLCTIAVRPDSGNILYAGSGSGTIAKSTDSGLSWHRVKNPGSTEIPRIVIDPIHPLIAYACAYESSNPADLGVWKTTDGGEHWGHTGLINISVWSLDIDQSHPDTVYAGSFSDPDAGVYQTTDGGATWTLFDQGYFAYNSMWNMHVDQMNPANVYMAATIDAFGYLGTFKFIDADAGVQGVVKDSLTGNPITSGTVQISPSGDYIDLAYTGGAYQIYRPLYDTSSTYTIDIYINGLLYVQQTAPFNSGTITPHDILVPRGSIQGTVYNDINHNGSQDGGEAGLPNRTVVLSGSSNLSMVTDANGHYSFNSLLFGSYSVAVRAGWDNTQATPANYPVNISISSKTYSLLDFGTTSQPLVVAESPVPFSVGNSESTSIQITFPGSMNTSTFNDSTSFIVHGSMSGRHRGTITFNGLNTIATFTPAAPFSAGEVVNVDISSNLKLQGDTAVGAYIYQFTISSGSSDLKFPIQRVYTVGVQPWGVAIGDIDNDGKKDIVTANYASGNISVLKNQGNGVFSSKVDYGTLLNQRAVSLADVNSDGWLDIIVGGNAQKVSVFLNNGDGTFGTRTDYNTGGVINALSVADMDGDGTLDIVVASTSGDNIIVLYNNGAGIFGSPFSHPGGSSPWGACAADLNGDGGVDVATANAITSATVTTSLNGGGTFLDILNTYPAGSFSRDVIVAPIDADHLPDIVVSNLSSNSISVYTNVNNGEFGGKTDYNTGVSPWGLASADLNGDGYQDIVTANVSDNTISILRNNGAGSFDTSITRGTGLNPRFVAIADIDNDGKLDLIVTNSGSNTITVYSTKFVASTSRLDGWNMFSVPFGSSNMTKTALYPDAISSAFTYHSSYSIEDTLEIGKGYWLKFNGAGTQSYIGSTFIAQDSIAVNAGWNLIGGLSNFVLKSTVTSSPSGIIHSPFYAYKAGYVSADTIFPGFAYWVKTTQAGKLFLALSSSSAPKNTADNFLSGVNRLTIKDNNGGSQTLYFTANSSLKNVLDQYEMPPVPPQGVFDARFASGRMLEYSGDTGNKEFPIKMNSVIYPLTLNWETKENAGTASIVSGSDVTSLSGTGSLVLDKPADGGLILRFADGANSVIPTAFALEQNYPNPFNPSTNLRYDVSQPASVSIVVYDILGRVVGTLVNGALPAGEYNVTWSAGNNSGGVYYIRMNAVDSNGKQVFHSVRKMLLVK